MNPTDWICCDCRVINPRERLQCTGCYKMRWAQLGFTVTRSVADNILGTSGLEQMAKAYGFNVPV